MSDSWIDVRALLDSPPWNSDRRLDAILHSLLRQREIELPSGNVDPASLWPASSFGLDRMTAYVDATTERRQEVLRHCATDRLAEALFIEKLGLSFCAKMTLLATTSDERMLYSLIAADEAAHFHWISCFTPNVQPHSPFLKLLADLVEEGTQTTLTMLVQVVLEGWGVHHYRLLARDCTHAVLREVLNRIVVDESRHHGSGERLMRQRSITPDGRAEVLAILIRLLAMVRSGPQAVVAAVAPSDAVQAFTQLGAEETRHKLELLRSLIASAQIDGIVDDLDFEPMSAEECAACLMS